MVIGDGDHECMQRCALANQWKDLTPNEDPSKTEMFSAGRLAELLAVALAAEEVNPALARGEALRLADVVAVAGAHASALEPVALRHAVPRLRHVHRPHLCMHTHVNLFNQKHR